MENILGDLSCYPFKSEVWGTVFDFSTVVLGVFSLFYLRKTFGEQSKFNKVQIALNQNQDLLNKLLLTKERLSLRPLFLVRMVGLGNLEKEVQHEFRFELHLGNASAMNIKIWRTDYHGKIVNPEIKLLDEELLMPGLVFSHSYIKPTGIGNRDLLLIKACDETGLEYQQYVRLVLPRISITMPKLVEG
ncbi:hypothetical protein [Olivibacter sitiensis]|uniref:hypothetical protein n=1 Tax=Olivibacter sitiensis TaxID=376470 RepID=UPI0012F8FE30|nr:hypothetical protein [Olivibacter sitiensis]